MQQVWPSSSLAVSLFVSFSAFSPSPKGRDSEEFGRSRNAKIPPFLLGANVRTFDVESSRTGLSADTLSFA